MYEDAKLTNREIELIMQIEATSPDDYKEKVPEDRIKSMSRLRAVINRNLPEGFQETLSYGMIG